MRTRMVLVLCAVLALSVGVATATGGNGNGGNSDAAKACQKGGWKDLARAEDGLGFKNQGDCVSYAARGGTLQPACTAGSENFSTDANLSKPTTFSGGTIDTAYGTTGRIELQGVNWAGAFAPGTHLLFTGGTVNSFQLTFTRPVGSVHLDAQSNAPSNRPTHLTLTGYNTANAAIATDTKPNPGGVPGAVSALSISSPTNTIKSITIANDDPVHGGLGFSNIVWDCN
jgi:hypothetical protein